MGEESCFVVQMSLLNEMNQWRQEYVNLFRGDEQYEYLKNTVLVGRMSTVSPNQPI